MNRALDRHRLPPNALSLPEPHAHLRLASPANWASWDWHRLATLLLGLPASAAAQSSSPIPYRVGIVAAGTRLSRDRPASLGMLTGSALTDDLPAERAI